MKINLLVVAALLMASFGASAAINCPWLNGKYLVTAEAHGGQEAGPYGSVRITKSTKLSDSCEYTLVSKKLSVFAEPLAAGKQTLIVTSAKDGSSSLVVSVVDSKNKVLATGQLFEGGNRLMLSFEFTGCGSQSGNSSTCGRDIFLN